SLQSFHFFNVYFEGSISDSDIPDNLIFYIYDSLIEGFIHWIKDEKIDWPGEDIDNIFHKVINIKIK
ncbi:hypothetical protein D9748_14445, partial [Staphylococcus aureus]